MQLRIFLLGIYVFFGIISAANAVQTSGVVATIKPLHALVSGVLGNTGAAELLLYNDASPHNFQLKPSQMVKMQDAKIIFYIDDSFEGFLPSTFRSLPSSVRRVALSQARGLNILPRREGADWEDAAEHDHHHHHAHGQDDMHIWLAPNNAIAMVKVITKELSMLYPQNRTIYKANARQMVADIAALNDDLKSSLAAIKNKPFIVFHDAYQYFEHAYGLKAVGAITLNLNMMSSPKNLSKVRQKLQKMGVRCVFREPQFSDRMIHGVIEGSNTNIGVLDPIGSRLVAGKDLYLNLLRNLANNLKTCLQ